MLLMYSRAFAYLLFPLRGPLMALAAVIACVALTTALLARHAEAQARATQPMGKLLQWRPRAAADEPTRQRRAA